MKDLVEEIWGGQEHILDYADSESSVQVQVEIPHQVGCGSPDFCVDALEENNNLGSLMDRGYELSKD